MYKSNYLHKSLASVCDSYKYFIYPFHVFGHNLDGKKTHEEFQTYTCHSQVYMKVVITSHASSI